MSYSPSTTEKPTALLLGARDTAKALSISERLLWTYTHDGEIPCLRVGRRVLYDPRDLRDWIDRQKVKGKG